MESVIGSIRTEDGRQIKATLSPQRRQLMLSVMDGHPDLAGVMHILHSYRCCDQILNFLVRNRIRGKTLAEMIVKQFGGSVPRLVDYVVENAKSRACNASR